MIVLNNVYRVRMMRIEEVRMPFRPSNPEQDSLLPPSLHDLLSPQPLCFFLPRGVEQLDLSALQQDCPEEGRPAYAPALGVKVWLYGDALGIPSSRRLEQGVREDLGFRYLAGGAQSRCGGQSTCRLPARTRPNSH